MIHILSYADQVVASQELDAAEKLRNLEWIQRLAKRYLSAAILLAAPIPGIRKRWSNPAQNPPRKPKAIDRLPRKLANARRRLARLSA